MAKTTNSPCPPGAKDKMASTGADKFNTKTIAKTNVVSNSSSKLKPRPATISRRISIAEIPTYFTPIPIAIKYWAAQIISAGGRLFKNPLRLKMAAKIKGPSIDAPNNPNFLAIHHPKTELIKSNMS